MIKKDNKFSEIQSHVFRYKIKRVRLVSKRIFLFRSNKNNNNDKELIKDFRKDEIVKFLIKNYLRYRNSEFDRNIKSFKYCFR